MASGEMLIVPGDSWFSAKSIYVECNKVVIIRGKALSELGGLTRSY